MDELKRLCIGFWNFFFVFTLIYFCMSFIYNIYLTFIINFKKEMNDTIHLIVDSKNNKEYLETDRYNREIFDIKDEIHMLEINKNKQINEISDLRSRIHTLEDQINNLINNIYMKKK